MTQSPRKTPSDFSADAHSPARAVRRRGKNSAHHTLLFGLAKNKRAVWSVVAFVALAVAAVAAIVLFTDISWASVIEWIEGVNPIAALPLMALLPIAGFPISVVYLFAGARFGPVWGGVIVAAITAVHLLGTYAIAGSFLRAPLKRFMERKHLHLPQIPEDEQVAVCVIAALVPGLPYVLRNYLLALAGVKIRYTLLVVLPIYVLRSYVTILLGNMGGDPSTKKLLILLGVDGVKVVICAFVIWRLRVHHQKFHGHDHEPPEPASDALPPPNAAAK